MGRLQLLCYTVRVHYDFKQLHVCMFYHHPLFPTELVCMLVRTMHEVREDMGPLVAMVMCNVPSDEPFTLIVQTSDGTAVGE